MDKCQRVVATIFGCCHHITLSRHDVFVECVIVRILCSCLAKIKKEQPAEEDQADDEVRHHSAGHTILHLVDVF